MKKFLTRTRFAKDIVAEVAWPDRQTGKVAILAAGAPSLPIKRGVLDFLASKGYTVIAPRYRGTWESGGNFLASSPALDISEVIREVGERKKIRDLFSGKVLSLKVSAIHLFGSSFGGPAVLLNTEHRLVKKVIALSPVIDWTQAGPDEPFDFFVQFTREGFGGAYRVKQAGDWQKLLTPHFYNPLSSRFKIAWEKVFILHAADDTVVPVGPLQALAKNVEVCYYIKPHGGHLGFSNIRQKFFWKKVSAFLRK